MAYILNPKYKNLEPFIKQLCTPDWFEENGTFLHDGRNKIKMFETNGLKIAVKEFGNLSLLNRIIYCTLRKSKARRAFEYAGRLKVLKIDTPEEIAYIEIRRKGLLERSYYVCLHTEYRSMLPLFYKRDLSPTEFNEITPLLDDLAAFLYRTHQAGVIHNDLNYTNILYKSPDGTLPYDCPGANECASENGKENKEKRSGIHYGSTEEGHGYSFTLIDINRMEFYKSAGNPQPLPLEKRLHNLRRLNVSVIAHLYIMQQYARIMGVRSQDLQLPVINMRYRFEHKRQRTQKIKNFIRGKKE